MTFKELGLNEQLIEAISYMGFENATPIQELTMPSILQGKDIIACAQTGTGKTAAFILPILNQLIEKPATGINTVVIVPTRELAIQIDQQINGFTYFTPISSMPIYGGGDGDNWEEQKRALTKGTDILIATPGKFISHLNMGYVKLDQVKHVILDEADRMLDIGFYDDILRIFSYFPKQRQTLMFSATMPKKIRDLATKTLRNPVEVSIAISKPAEGVTQKVYLSYEPTKPELVKALINQHSECKSILVFSSTKRDVQHIVKALRGNGYKVEGISSDLEQKDREDVLNRFKARHTRVLVATDVLSRGIDIKDINLVINYHVPNDAEDYVHRIGRTARAETKGLAITLVVPDEMYKFHRIERLIEKEVDKFPTPATIGESPEWNALGGQKQKRFNKNRKKPFSGKSGNNKS